MRTFIVSHVRTVSELQLLMAIIHSRDRSWDAASAAREVGMSEGEARAALEHFAARNLLDIRIGADLRYQFRPGTAELHEGARAAAEVYRQRPVDIARLLPPERRSVSDFADAFRIRRDDSR